MIDTVQRRISSTRPLDTIDELHGGMESFLRDQMSLDDEKLKRLEELYLE